MGALCISGKLPMVGSPRLMDWRLIERFLESSRIAAVKYGILNHGLG